MVVTSVQILKRCRIRNRGNNIEWGSHFQLGSRRVNNPTYTKMDFPPPWDFFPAEEFELAAPRDPGYLGAELMAQCRDNGRINDHFRIALAGTKLVETYISLKA